MTRFYTDPLAAAWMAKHFGMRFVEHGSYSGTIIYTEGRNGDTAIAEHSRYTIHPASLHLLEPLVGDILNWQTGKGEPWWEDHSRYIYPPQGTHDVFTAESAARMLGKPELSAKIIRRDGRVFFWPESEAA